MSNVPWFLPGVLASLLVAITVAVPLARRLGVSRWAAGLLVMAVGIIVAATLTPLRGALGGGDLGGGGCDLSRIGLIPAELLFTADDAFLNIVLFVPLGVAVAWLPPARSWRFVAVGALAFPVVIEVLQSVVVVLDRGCEVADIIDNLVGLGIGVAIGTVARRVLSIDRDDPLGPSR